MPISMSTTAHRRFLAGLFNGHLTAANCDGRAGNNTQIHLQRWQGVRLRRRRAAKMLIVCELGLALVLLVGAGLLLKSFHRLTTIDLGFNTNDLLTLRIDLNADRYTPEVRTQFARELSEKSQALPGVKSATIWGPGMPGRATLVVKAIPVCRNFRPCC